MATPTDEKIEHLQSYTEQVSRSLCTKCLIKGYMLQFKRREIKASGIDSVSATINNLVKFSDQLYRRLIG